MKTKIILASLSVLALSNMLFAQQNNRISEFAEKIITNDKGKIDIIAIKASKPVYQNNIEPFINSNILNDKALVKPTQNLQDELGYNNTKYKVYINNVLVHNYIIATHSKNGKLETITGDLNSLPSVTNSIQLNKTNALSIALKKVNAKKYKWENKAEEEFMKKLLNDPDFSFQPKGEIVLYNTKNNTIETLNYAYKFDIFAEEPLYRANIFVDAQTGKILGEEVLIHTADVPATANTRFSGVQTMTVDNFSAGMYRLRETSRGLGIETYNLNTSTNFTSAVDYTNTTTSWTTTTIDQVGTDAHWGAEQVYDYYLLEHNRNSIDNAGQKLLSYANYGVGYNNASWNGFFMTYGSGSNGGFTGLDVCGHEITHGLTSKTANLVYQNESGALNESYSDIFGACIENFGKPAAFNWTIGEDVGGIRSMSNPNAFSQPDTYLGTSWYTGTADNGGVHTNSGVSNYWFYLLCQGGSGTNDIANTYTVSGLGMTTAAKIAFRALTLKYGANTDYSSARNLSVLAAEELYGVCSNEVFQTKSAWYAVGVGPSPSGTITPVSNFISTQSSPCSLPFTANFINTSFGADTYVWDFGDGSAVSTATNPIHTYTANGTYSVKLKSFSACAALPDSIIQTGYITVNALANSTGTPAVRCDSGFVTLNASGTDMQYWYANSTATGTPLYIGNTYSTPTLTNSSTFYVVNTSTNPAIYGGPANTSIGTGANFPGTTPYEIFDVYQPCTLKSVIVSASSAGNRVIQLRNSSNAVIQSATVTLAAGTNTVNLNFNLIPGYGYRLGLGSGLAQLYRNNSGVSYPYSIGSLIDITGSSLGPIYYFFFYNWEVAPANCTSAPVAITASVNPLPSIAITSQTMACKDDSLVALTATPLGGNFSGPSVGANNFNPSIGAGTYYINYSYTDANNCSNTDSVAMIVDLCTGIHELNTSNIVSIYPNPSIDVVMVKIEKDLNGILFITDITGKLLFQEQINKPETKINISHLASGIYFVRLRDNFGKYSQIKIFKN